MMWWAFMTHECIHADMSVQHIHWTTAKDYAVKRDSDVAMYHQNLKWKRAQQSSLLGASVMPHIHRAWITLYLHYSPPVAALYMCSTLSTTDLCCLHFVPSKSCPCIEDCCSGASKTLYSNWWTQNRLIHPSILSPHFDKSLECLFSHHATYDTMNWTQEDSLVLF